MSLEFMPYYTINYNHYEKIDNVITEKDICITFDKSNKTRRCGGERNIDQITAKSEVTP